ncbi:hypothetical protein G681_04944, partial [Escherichia coli HVH 1 (4-6876161)]
TEMQYFRANPVRGLGYQVALF